MIMKRKVIQIANSTQLVSLPRAWAIQNKIKKGDEVEVMATTQGLLISKEAQKEQFRKIEVRVPNQLTAQVILSALYKGGYDEVRLIVNKADEIERIQHFVSSNCQGFGVVEHGRNYIVVRKFSDELPEQFFSVLNRMISFILNMASECHEAVKKSDRGALKNVVLMDDNINKYAYYCLRMINKFPEALKEPTGPLYFIVEQLEGVGDAYKHLATFLSKQKKISPHLVKGLKVLKDYLEATTRLLRTRKHKDSQALLEISIMTTRIIEDLLTKKADSVKDLAYLYDINICIKNITAPIMILCFHEESLYEETNDN